MGKITGNPASELYFTNQLLKADSIISLDFKKISKKIHKEFDTITLLEAKKSLEKTNYFNHLLLIISLIIIVVLVVILSIWYRRKKKLK